MSLYFYNSKSNFGEKLMGVWILYTQAHSKGQEKARQVSPAGGSREWGGEEGTDLSSPSVPNHWWFPTQTQPGNSHVPQINDPGASELLVSLSTHVLIFSQMKPSVLWRTNMGYMNFLWGTCNLYLTTPKVVLLLPMAECHRRFDHSTNHGLWC